MVRTHPSPAEIRAGLGHPVLDMDSHAIEYMPAFLDVLAEVGGPQAVDAMLASEAQNRDGWTSLTPDERRDRGAVRGVWWTMPTANARDRATCMAPRLLYERLDELGIDFSVVYPSRGLAVHHTDDPDLRRAFCRAFNQYQAEQFRPYADRLTPVGVVPLHTPDEGIEELRYAKSLGLKTFLVPSYVTRPIAAAGDLPPSARRYATRMDVLAMDSEHDYDPFWAECVKLHAPITTHSVGIGWGSRRSTSSFVYNHIGHFAAANEAFCKALFLGGVVFRFPQLRVAFMEGGALYGMNLLADFVAHWDKRRVEALDLVDPANLDRAQLTELLSEYGTDAYRRHLAAGETRFEGDGSNPEQREKDEFSRCEISDADDVRRPFRENFFFGCEPDDPTTHFVFQGVEGVKVNAVLGSDIGHYDVPDLLEVLPEVVEAYEDGKMSADDLADFSFRNALRFYVDSDPTFFDGTILESSAKEYLAATVPPNRA